MVLTIVFLAAVGAAMGSFVGALVWRLHGHRDFVRDRSECEHCHHKLGPLDLVPIASWLALSGKCRYCGHKIGWQALAVEVGMAVLFVLSYLCWPHGLESSLELSLFVLWLLQLVVLGALLIYDLRWMLLPDKLVIVLVGLALLELALRLATQPFGDVVASAGLGLIPITGVYGVLYLVSRGAWVGLGDVKLGVYMGLVLGWQKALLVLMLANVIGFIILVPGLLSGKVDRKSHVPFGPFLIVAFVIASLWGDMIVNWFMSSALFLT